MPLGHEQGRSGTAPTLTLNARGAVGDVAFDRGGTLLAAGCGGGMEGAIRIWEVPTGQPVQVLEDQRAQVTGVAFSPVENLLASASAFGTVRLWR